MRIGKLTSTTKTHLAVLTLSMLGLTGTSLAATAPDTFTMTTTAMTPRDVTLRINLRAWSDDAGRAAAVAALADEGNAQAALAGLPSLGHVWQSGSPVGYAVKYAHRVSTPQGERITFITDRRLGSYESKPWTAEKPAAQELPYSVIELYLDGGGSGAGSLSLAADVQVDEAEALVSLGADAPRVLADAQREPKPYWATE
jgi:hypothetical protein